MTDADPAGLIDPSAARALLQGRCGMPFDHLGLHKRGDAWLLTVCLPGATTVEMLTGARSVTPLEPLQHYP